MQRVLRLLLGCCVLLSTNSEAKSQLGLFKDWLAAQQTAGQATLASGVQPTAAELGSYDVCLQEVKDRHCRCLNTNSTSAPQACLRFYVESMFTCCGDSVSSAIAEVRPVAQCSFTEDYFSKAVEVTGVKATKIGVFTAVCTMRAGADKCEDGLVEGITLNVEGSIMRSSRIAFVGQPTAPTQDEDCKTSLEGPLSDKKDFSNTGSAAAAKVVKTAGYEGGEEQDEEEAEVARPGSGDVYLGDFWVAGPGSSKVDSGVFQLVYVRQVDSSTEDEPLSAPPESYFAAKPYSLLLQLHKGEGYAAQR